MSDSAEHRGKIPSDQTLNGNLSEEQAVTSSFMDGKSPSEEPKTCRMCHGSAEDLRSACGCRGSLRYVHSQCLHEWIICSGCTHCELCGCQFRVSFAPRYWLLHALWLWLSTKVARAQLVRDAASWLCSVASYRALSVCLEQLSLGWYRRIAQTAVGGQPRWTYLVIATLLFQLSRICNLKGFFLVCKGAASVVQSWYCWWLSTFTISVRELGDDSSPISEPVTDID